LHRLDQTIAPPAQADESGGDHVRASLPLPAMAIGHRRLKLGDLDGQRAHRPDAIITAAIAAASATRAKCSMIPVSSARRLAPWYGGISMTMAAPAALARRARSAAIAVPKWLVVTMTGTRPATWSRQTRISVSRSSS